MVCQCDDLVKNHWWHKEIRTETEALHSDHYIECFSLIKSLSNVHWGHLPHCPINAGKKSQNRSNEHMLPTCSLTLTRTLRGLCVLLTKMTQSWLSAGGPCRLRQEWRCGHYCIFTWQADSGETSKTDHSFLTFSWIPSLPSLYNLINNMFLGSRRLAII